MVVVQTVPDFGDNLSTDHQKNIYLQTVIIDYAQRTSRSENPFLIVLKLVSNDPLYGLVINLNAPPPPYPLFSLVERVAGDF